MKKILVIGCKGQLGQDCVSVFSENNLVTGLDYPEIDITSEESVSKIIDQIQPDWVINCAAYTDVERAESDHDACFKVNAVGPKNLAKACKKTNSGLIHISTDYVFDLGCPHDADEWCCPNPLNAYGKSKLAGENEILNSDLDQGFVVRTAWLYSQHKKNFLKTMLRLAIKGSPFKVVDDQYGCPTWSYSLAKQIRTITENSDRIGPRLIHAAGQGFTSWYEFAKTFLDLMEIDSSMMSPCKTEDYPTKAKRPASSILKDKVLFDAGFLEIPSWKTDLETFVQKYKADLIIETYKLLSNPEH